MKRLKEWYKKVELTLILTIFVLFIILTTFAFLFLGIILFRWLGWLNNPNFHIPTLLPLAFISLIIGTIISLMINKKPLSPIHTVVEATNKIAKGDYSTRLDLKWPDEFAQLSDSFNYMAQELGSVEMLRNDFVNNFSHEFKTPIVSIRGFAKMLKREDLSPEEKHEYLDIIISETERLTELSTNILNLSKLEKQSILTDKSQFNLSEQIRLTLAMLESKWQSKKIDFDFECGEIQVVGNEDLLQQIWLNLIDNAIKFSPENEKVKIRISEKKDCKIITVSDYGEGMSEETASHIFDKFYQGDTSHAEKGNGLGLTIAKRIATLHGGNITVYSKIGEGTTFEVTLPTLTI